MYETLHEHDAYTYGIANADVVDRLERIERAILAQQFTFTGRDMKVAVDKATFDYDVRSR